MKKNFLCVTFSILLLMSMLSCCSKKDDVYAMPEIPKGEAVVTDKNVSKPASIRYFSNGEALDLNAAQTDSMWAGLNDLFNSEYVSSPYDDILTEKDIEGFKRKKNCLELTYTQIQISENFSESYKAYRYYGVLIVLNEYDMRYIKYSSDSVSRTSSDGFFPTLSGEGFAEAYASLLEKIEELRRNL